MNSLYRIVIQYGLDWEILVSVQRRSLFGWKHQYYKPAYQGTEVWKILQEFKETFR